MLRQPRLDAPGTLHHVMGRGIERTKIFKNKTDQEDFLKVLHLIADNLKGQSSCGEKWLNHSLVESWLILITGEFPAMQDKETIAEERKRILETGYEEWKYEL